METKKCNRCGQTKPVSDFQPKPYGGKLNCYYSICKKCNNQRQREYDRTPEGKAKQAFSNMYYRSENRDGHHRQYANVKFLLDKDIFLKWAVPELTRFMDENPDCTPSFDRIDSSGHYEMSNLRILDFELNCSKVFNGNLQDEKARMLGRRERISMKIQHLKNQLDYWTLKAKHCDQLASVIEKQLDSQTN